MATKKAETGREPFSVGDLKVRAIRGPKDGAWYWRAERYSGGDSETVWTGWRTRPEAIAEVARLVGTSGRTATARAGSVRDLLIYWHGAIEQRHDLAPKTVKLYGWSADLLQREIGAVQVDTLSRVHLEGLRDRMIRERTPRSVALHLRVLRIAWRWGRETGWAPDRDLPAVAVRLPELVRAEPEEAEVEALLGAAPPRLRLALQLLLSTGCRIGEVMALRWEDVASRSGRTWITVTGKGRRRSIPLPAALAEELIRPATAAPGDRVLEARSNGLRAWLTPRAAWTPHSLRRLAVRRLYRSGVDVGTAAALLGHSPGVALAHYHRAREEDLLAAVDRIDPHTNPHKSPK